MSEFNFNHSVIDEKYRIVLNQDMINALRAQARIILVPFFREICIQFEKSENEKEYPILTTLCEKIIENVFEEGEIDYESVEEAEEIAITFLSKLTRWQKTCLAIYFCSDMEFIEKLQEENEDEEEEENILTLEQMYEQDGIKIRDAAFKLSKNDTEMAEYLVKELIHVQDIFSNEDISNWDASSIVFANENFEQYAGNGQILIPIKLDEFEYWEKLLDKTEGDDEDEI